MGIRRPVPNAFDVTLSPGAACFLLYSFILTASITQVTVSRSKPADTISSIDS